MKALSLCLLGQLIHAKQPSAPAASPAPLRELPWGQLNFLHTTDTHGWHGGHLQEPQYSADWGDYVSFTAHLRNRSKADGSDLLVIDTGDRLEGNGLYDGSVPPGKYTYDIFKNQAVDIMTCGNHELYINTTASSEFQRLVPMYTNSYLASNLNITSPITGQSVPFAQRFKKFRTPNQNITILAFGFIYNFGRYANNVQIQKVQDAVKETWFQNAIKDSEVDLFLVAGHMQLDQQLPWLASSNKPIVFFGGHSHIRAFQKYDHHAYGIESGRYAETVGFLSMSGLVPSKAPLPILKYSRRYIDTNLFSYYSHTKKHASNFDTPLGLITSSAIAADRAALGLDKPYGCAPRDLALYRAPYPSNQSILTWLETQVLPATWLPLLSTRGQNCSTGTGRPMLVMTNSGAIRFDIFKGPYTVDSNINISPFTSGFRCLTAVPYALASKLMDKLNNGPPILMTDWRESTEERSRWLEDLEPPFLPPSQPWSDEEPFARVDVPLQHPFSDLQPSLLPGYVTNDTLGDTGDDSVRRPYGNYPQPNVIGTTVGYSASTVSTYGEGQANTKTAPPDVVEIYYNEFMEGAVLAALKNLSGGTQFGPTQVAINGSSLTTIVANWVQKNWPCGKTVEEGTVKEDL